MDGKSSWVIQSQWDGNTRLETSVYPDLNPAPLLVKVPGQHDARLHDLKDILPAGHCPVDVLPRFTGMKLGKLVSADAINGYGGGV